MQTSGIQAGGKCSLAKVLVDTADQIPCYQKCDLHMFLNFLGSDIVQAETY